MKEKKNTNSQIFEDAQMKVMLQVISEVNGWSWKLAKHALQTHGM